MTSPAPGWYPNPDPNVGGNRYWDGAAWTITDSEYRSQSGNGGAAIPPSGSSAAVWTAARSSSLSSDELAKRKSLNKKILIGAGSLLTLLIVIGAIGAASDSGSSSDENVAVDTASEATASTDASFDEEPPPSPTQPPKPSKPIDVVAEAVADSDAKSASAKQLDARTVEVTFKVADNFTNGLIRGGIAMDSFDVARRVSEADVPYRFLSLVGTFPLIDKYGNESDGKVFSVTFDLNEIRKINWDNFVPTEIEDVEAFSTTGLVFLFPDLRE